MSLPEALLWRHLRQANPRIRRQHPIGDIILDFYCPAAKLAIEVDGAAHAMGDRPARDEARTAWLQAQGLTVVRIAAKDVLAHPLACADAIIRMCDRP